MVISVTGWSCMNFRAAINLFCCCIIAAAACNVCTAAPSCAETAHELQEQGEDYLENHKLKSALETFNKAIKLYPKEKNFYHLRSVAFSEMRQPDKALADMDAYLKLAPEKAIGYFWRAALYENMGKTQQAIDDYTLGIKYRNGRYFNIFESRAKLYCKLGKLKEALADFTTVIDDNPYEADALNWRGNIYMNLGQYQKAVKDYTAAIEANPDENGSLYEMRSKAWDKLGKHDLAAKDAAKARELIQKAAVKKI